jgi:hypothetical protein
MVSIKQAFANAAEFAASVLELEDPRLEEVETAEANGAVVWLITLSMVRSGAPFNNALAALSNFRGVPRDYKTFTIRKDTGEVLSMKIRELAGA